jgi:peptidoglycan/xylan/chitin deacetylase (PgdA/CDA1 family)
MIRKYKLCSYSHSDRNDNRIALTFDDGPNPFWTEKILDVLDKHGIKANFFVLGKWAEKNQDIVKLTLDKGHLIGNHSYSHPDRGDADFEKAEKIINRITGEQTKFIRPPYNNDALCKGYCLAVTREVTIINNDVVSYDWKYKSDEIKKRIIGDTRNGSILLLHDGSERDEELESRPAEMFKVLPWVIEHLKSRFDLVRLDEMKFDC